MKLKVVLNSILVLAILFTSVVSVYAYGASTFTIRLYSPIKLTTADAFIGTPGLRDGVWRVYAKVDDTDSDADFFKNELVFASASDFWFGASSDVKAVASAGVCGYDAADEYKCDFDDDEI